MSGTIEALQRAALWRMAGGAALISTTSIFVKLAHVDPTASAFYRMLFGGLMLLLLLLAGGGWRRIGISDLLWLFLPALAFAIDLFLWHRSIRDVGPGLATLLANFQVFIMALVGVLFFRERLSAWFLIGLLSAMFGLWLLVGPGWAEFDSHYRIGVIFGLLTGFAYAAYLLTTRYAQNGRVLLAPQQLLCVCTLLCAGVLGVAVRMESASFAIPDLQSWAALLGLGLFGQVMGWVLIIRAMPYLPASLIGLLLLLQPSLSFVLDVLVFDRATNLLDWTGVSLTLVGIFIGSQRNKSRPDEKLRSAAG